MRKIIIAFCIALTFVFLGCSSEIASSIETPYSTPEATITPIATPISFPTPQIPALIVEGLEGKRPECIYLDVVQNGQNISTDIAMKEIIQNLGIQIVKADKDCDAILLVEISCTAIGGYYSNNKFSGYSYSGASTSGTVTLAFTGENPVVRSFSRSIPLPDQIPVLLENPAQAPYSTWGLYDILLEFWGIPVMVESLDVSYFKEYGLNDLNKLKSEERFSEDIILRLIAKLFGSDDSIRREFVADMLGNADADSEELAISALKTLLYDENNEVITASIRSLLNLDPDEADIVFPLLLNLLRGDDETAIGNAAELIGSLSPYGEEAIPELIALLEKSNGLIYDTTEVQIINALAEFGPAAKDAESILRIKMNPASAGLDKEIQAASALALSKICTDNSVVLELADKLKTYDLDYDIAKNVMQALADMGPLAAAAVPTLVDLHQRAEKADIKNMIYKTLGKIGPAAIEAVPCLEKVINDPNQQPGSKYRTSSTPYAIEALYRIGSINADETMEMLISYLEFGDPMFDQVDAMLVIQNMDPIDAAQALPILSERLCTYGCTYDNVLVLRAIGNIGHLAVGLVPDIIPLLSGGYEYAEDTALEALIAISGENYGKDVDAWLDWYQNIQGFHN